MTRKRYKAYEIENPLDSLSFVQKTSERILRKKNHWHHKIFSALILIFFLIVFARLFYLQILNGHHYQQLANRNRIREDVIKAARGIIKDKNGIILARNIPSFELDFIPAYLPPQNSWPEMATKLSQLLQKDREEILQKLREAVPNSQQTYQLVDYLDRNLALKLAEKMNDFPGLVITKSAHREYPLGRVCAHIIGYTGKITKEELQEYPNYLLIDYVGKNGLEKTYEKYLHGVPGKHRFEVNSRGQIVADLGVKIPQKGYDALLNIDAKLQEKIYQEAEKIMSENKDATGVAVVALDPRDGAVRAMVSYPSYDDNDFSQGISPEKYKLFLNDPFKPLINRTIAGLYPPGSTFKPLVATAALQEGVIDEHTTVNCHGEISIGQWRFPDWSVHRITDVKKAIAQSCDVFFYTVGGGWQNIRGLGINRVNKYAKLFGLGDYLGIDIPGEKKGLVPGATWKFKRFGEKWYIGDTYHAAIGQGYVTATPLQMAVATATIANGGTVYRPRLVAELFNSETKDRIKIEKDILFKDFIKPENIKIVQEGMRQTVTAGSGRLLNSLKVTSAGKTGTAQFGSEGKTHSWYVSFAPYEKPELALAVLVESGGEGHQWAVPLTREIYQWYFDEKEGSKQPEKKKEQAKPEATKSGNREQVEKNKQ